MLLREIKTNQNKLKERIGFIFYIAFSSRIRKSVCKKKEQWTETRKKNLRHLSQTQKNY